MLIEQGNANTDIKDKQGNSLMHYAAIGQGNAILYIRYLVGRGVSTLGKNNDGLTAREMAEQSDKNKY